MPRWFSSQFLCLSLFLLTGVHAAQVPPELERALKLYRAEGAPNWAFVQTTASADLSLVERFDPSKPEFSRWTLLQKDGAPPSEAEITEYRERLSRRTNGTAPNVRDQIDPASCEVIQDDAERASYRFKLKPGEKDDRSAGHMNAVFTLNKASGTIERVVLCSKEPFSPMFAVRISEARTEIIYSNPTSERPTLLQSITVHMRGRVMWFKSLDADMTVTFSEHTFVGKPLPRPDENPARADTSNP